MSVSEKLVKAPAAAQRSAKVIPIKSAAADEHSAAIKGVRELEIETPLVLMAASELEQSLSRFQRTLPDVELYYAVKANSSRAALRYFADRGVGFDVASASEIRLLVDLGVSGDRMILSHPVKDLATIRAMIAHRVKAFAVDSIAELEKIAKVKPDYSPEVFVRVRTESEDVQIDLNEKYGCRLVDAADILKTAQDLGFTPTGLTFHVGTQSYLASNFQTGLDHCLVVAEQVRRKHGIRLTTFNIGGGFCDRDVASKHGVSIESVFEEIGAIVKESISKGFKIIAEPGRSLVCHAGSLVCQVIGIHNRGGSSLVHIDDGVYGVLSGQMFDHRTYTFEPVARGAGEEPLADVMTMSRICGRTCDSIDMMDGVHPLPKNMKVGDLLLVRNIGAYGTATASLFNGFTPAESYLFESDRGSIRFPDVEEDASNNDRVRSALSKTA